MIANNKAWRSAEQIRREWQSSALARKNPPNGALRYILTETRPALGTGQFDQPGPPATASCAADCGSIPVIVHGPGGVILVRLQAVLVTRSRWLTLRPGHWPGMSRVRRAAGGVTLIRIYRAMNALA